MYRGVEASAKRSRAAQRLAAKIGGISPGPGARIRLEFEPRLSR